MDLKISVDPRALPSQGTFQHSDASMLESSVNASITTPAASRHQTTSPNVSSSCTPRQFRNNCQVLYPASSSPFKSALRYPGKLTAFQQTLEARMPEESLLIIPSLSYSGRPTLTDHQREIDDESDDDGMMVMTPTPTPTKTKPRQTALSTTVSVTQSPPETGSLDNLKADDREAQKGSLAPATTPQLPAQTGGLHSRGNADDVKWESMVRGVAWHKCHCTSEEHDASFPAVVPTPEMYAYLQTLPEEVQRNKIVALRNSLHLKPLGEKMFILPDFASEKVQIVPDVFVFSKNVLLNTKKILRVPLLQLMRETYHIDVKVNKGDNEALLGEYARQVDSDWELYHDLKTRSHKKDVNSDLRPNASLMSQRIHEFARAKAKERAAIMPPRGGRTQGVDPRKPEEKRRWVETVRDIARCYPITEMTVSMPLHAAMLPAIDKASIAAKDVAIATKDLAVQKALSLERELELCREEKARMQRQIDFYEQSLSAALQRILSFQDANESPLPSHSSQSAHSRSGSSPVEASGPWRSTYHMPSAGGLPADYSHAQASQSGQHSRSHKSGYGGDMSGLQDGPIYPAEQPFEPQYDFPPTTSSNGQLDAHSESSPLNEAVPSNAQSFSQSLYSIPSASSDVPLENQRTSSASFGAPVLSSGPPAALLSLKRTGSDTLLNTGSNTHQTKRLRASRAKSSIDLELVDGTHRVRKDAVPPFLKGGNAMGHDPKMIIAHWDDKVPAWWAPNPEVWDLSMVINGKSRIIPLKHLQTLYSHNPNHPKVWETHKSNWHNTAYFMRFIKKFGVSGLEERYGDGALEHGRIFTKVVEYAREHLKDETDAT